MNDPLYTMAFVTGFLGSGHCIGMCGGIVAALSLSGREKPVGLFFHLMYNSGRIMTYSFIGAVVGFVGSAMAYTQSFAWITRIALVLSDLFVIAIGLGTAGAFKRINLMRLEFAGPVQTMTAAVHRLTKLPAYIAALPLGMLMGFLPCGFLYAMFIAAGQSASPLSGALTMFSFGIGTAPALFLFGSAAHWLSAKARGWMLRGAGLMVVLMGCYNLYRHVKMIDWIISAVPFKWICCP